MRHPILTIEDQDADFEAVERGLRRLDVEISYRLGANSFVRKTFDFAEVNLTLERLAHFWLETAVLPSDGQQ